MTPSDEPRNQYPRGTYTKVARRLGVTPQSVRLVALGKATSARIAAQLRYEARLARRRKSAIAQPDAA